MNPIQCSGALYALMTPVLLFALLVSDTASAVKYSDGTDNDYLPLPCGAPPERAAIQFFNVVEQPQADKFVRANAPTIFSSRLLSKTPISNIIDFIVTTTDQYGINNVERSFYDRGVEIPDRRGMGSKDSTGEQARDTTIAFLSVGRKGKLEQRVTLTCEGSVWKVVGFSYGAAGF